MYQIYSAPCHQNNVCVTYQTLYNKIDCCLVIHSFFITASYTIDLLEFCCLNIGFDVILFYILFGRLIRAIHCDRCVCFPFWSIIFDALNRFIFFSSSTFLIGGILPLPMTKFPWKLLGYAIIICFSWMRI